MANGLVTLAGLQQEGRQVKSERNVVRHRGNRCAQAVQYGGFGFHATPSGPGAFLVLPFHSTR
jgi:hypothetical protein